MLSGVPASISPELLKVLHEMGHGDTLVIGDANFPAASIAAEKNHINIRCDGHRATDMLDAILQLMPWAFWTGSRSMMRQRMPMRWYPPQRRHFMPAL